MQTFHSVPSSALPNRRPSIPLAALFLLFGLSFFSPAQGATITVESNNDSINPINGCTLRGAVDALNRANHFNGCIASGTFGVNDKIIFAASLANSTIPINKQIEIKKNMLIDGGDNAITLKGSGFTRLFYVTGGTAFTFANLTFTNGNATNYFDNYNTSLYGGAIMTNLVNINDHTLTVRNCAFRSNRANLDGGAIAVHSYGQLIVENSSFTGNSARYGGAIWKSNSIADISTSTFTGNSASNGGAINAYIVSVHTSTLTNNSASNGGAIWAHANLNTDNSTFNGNSAQFGGAIYIQPAGGGYAGGVLTAVHATLLNNKAPTGAAIYTSNGTLNNSLIIGDSSIASRQCYSSYINGDANLEWRASTGNENSCKSRTPVLVPAGTTLTQVVSDTLADNGGPTQTLALPEGSPAIDTGDPAYVIATDQRGFARPAGNGPDLGAFEAEPPPVVPTGMTASVIVSKNDILSTIRGFFEPDPQHLGQTGAAFVFILMPDLYWFLSSSSMGLRGVPGDCLSTTAFYVGPLQTMAEMPIFTDKNLSRFLGGKLYIGYGLGSHALSSTIPSPACLDMFANQRYVEVYTIE